jgi:PD-(D/E)XK nuclease superfamily
MLQVIPEAACLAYQGLAKEIGTAIARADQHAKATHERFNVFSTLLKESDEVRLHARFLHCLLDPQGSHDCGSLFLKLFLQTLRDLQPIDHKGELVKSAIPIDERPWTVFKEASRAKHGQIDLLLESPGFAIAIENKIYAGEQSEQLERYSKYLQSRRGNSILIYLTLDGKVAHTAGKYDYCRISYRDHILAWIDLCLRETYHIIPVNQALIQYRAIVRRLTNQNLESEFMKPVLEIIRQNPDFVRHRQILTRSIDAVRSEVLDDLADLLIAKAKASGCDALLNPSLRGGRFGTDPIASLWITPHATIVLREIPYKIWFEMNCACILLGMKVPDGINRLDSKWNLLFAEMNRLMSQDPGRSESHESSPNWAWPTGWERPVDPLNDDVIANWMKPGQLNADVERIWKAIENHIHLLERAYLAVVEKDPSLSFRA